MRTKRKPSGPTHCPATRALCAKSLHFLFTCSWTSLLLTTEPYLCGIYLQGFSEWLELLKIVVAKHATTFATCCHRLLSKGHFNAFHSLRAWRTAWSLSWFHSSEKMSQETGLGSGCLPNCGPGGSIQMC